MLSTMTSGYCSLAGAVLQNTSRPLWTTKKNMFCLFILFCNYITQLCFNRTLWSALFWKKSNIFFSTSKTLFWLLRNQYFARFHDQFYLKKQLISLSIQQLNKVVLVVVLNFYYFFCLKCFQILQACVSWNAAMFAHFYYCCLRPLPFCWLCLQAPKCVYHKFMKVFLHFAEAHSLWQGKLCSIKRAYAKRVHKIYLNDASRQKKNL